ncbi:hypothetical protein MWU58_14265 [Flavobacteriaceae bacterium S0825]|uniref:hypothetical protein n=1 Tax=Gaetbulibacter sp. S0825 TaxID=2720084 RepID=UPI001431D211|nr:hypothetical protein [Gaetbulibacter sp. S0825]MCK0110462.1 hypothetical protein [Flavobacteriaceae bacterium S0825]NIX66091.1 hypothetical protein [Gaetbulibacter sp. S0825]
MKQLLKILTIFCFFNSHAQTDIKEFYFSKNNNVIPKIFKYVNLNDSTDQFFWKVIYDKEKDLLTTEGFNEDFFKFNSFVEKYIKNGTIVVEFINYEKLLFSFKKEHIGEIVENNVIKWDDDEEYKYQIKITSEYGNTTLIKKRKFIGYETIQVNGKSYNCVKFMENYVNTFHDQNVTFKFHQITYYTSNLGMIKCIKYFDDETLVYELSSILTDKEFDNLKD